MNSGYSPTQALGLPESPLFVTSLTLQETPWSLFSEANTDLSSTVPQEAPNWPLQKMKWQDYSLPSSAH